MDKTNKEQDLLLQFQSLPEDGQRRVCDALAMEEAGRKFQAMPPEKQEAIHDSLARLFAQLEADWRAKPANAGKTMKYSELWEEHVRNLKPREGGAP